MLPGNLHGEGCLSGTLLQNDCESVSYKVTVELQIVSE